MSKCPELEYEDTGWFSWRDICGVTGAIVGSEHDKVKVEHLCDAESGDCYKDCPIYRAKH